MVAFTRERLWSTGGLKLNHERRFVGSHCDLHLSGLSFIVDRGFVDRVFVDVDARSGVCRGRIKKNTKKDHQKKNKKTEKPVRGWG